VSHTRSEPSPAASIRRASSRSQLVALGGHQNPGEHGPGLIARGGPRDAVDRLLERLRRQLDRLPLRLRKTRKVIRRKRAQVEARGPGGELDVPLGFAPCQGHRPLRQRTNHLHQQAPREDDGACCFDLGLETDVEPELHVGRPQADCLLCRDQDAGQGLERGASRDRARDDQQRIE
jgi:hypothetical protein